MSEDERQTAEIARLRDLLRKAADALEDLLCIPDKEYDQLCVDIRKALSP